MILVIGSNCFSGAHFVNHCLRCSDSEIVGISRSQEYAHAYLPYRWDEHDQERYKFHQFDLNENLNEIVGLIAREKPRYIVNFAAQGMVHKAGKIRGIGFRQTQWVTFYCTIK